MSMYMYIPHFQREKNSIINFWCWEAFKEAELQKFTILQFLFFVNRK